MEFSVQVDKPSHITRKLTIRVAAKEVNTRFQRGLAEVQKTAKLKGFRPGMVPISVVKQYYGEDVRHQVFHDLIDESYREALREQKIKAVGRPQIDSPDHKTGAGDHDHSVAEDKDLNFTATVEVLPEIEVKNYKGIALTEGKKDVTDQDIEIVIKGLLDSQSELVPAAGGLANADGSMSSRPAKKGDFADMAFSGGLVTPNGIEEKPGMKGSRVLEIGSDQLIPGFEENMIGMRAGETKSFRIPFPADYFEAEMAGKEAEFTVTVNELKEKKLPELNDEFVKTMGYENLADMRKKAEEHLIRERSTDVERKMKSDLLSSLIESNPFDCPESLIAAQTRALAQDVAQNLKQQGFNDQMVQEALTAELNNLKQRAENQVRASLLLEAIAKKEKIVLTEADKDAEMKKMAESMRVEEDKLRDFYVKNPARLEDLDFRLMEEHTVKFLIQNAKVKKEK